ncbi:MAG TPA: hypothetical protein DDX92_06120 [Flavobacteriales bacterium]|jgi:gliding motility-associated-like protein|nr:hypothetical protein [Flavobacteriales bacterium]
MCCLIKRIGLIFLVTAFALTGESLFAQDGKSTGLGYQFVQNQGQFENQVLFRVDIPQGALFIEKDALTYHFYDHRLASHNHSHDPDLFQEEPLKFHSYQASFEGSSPDVQVIGESKFKHHLNYYLGSDPTQWASNVEVFKGVLYKNLYPGIDFRISQNPAGGLKTEYIVHPGANPSLIRIRYQGLDDLSIENRALKARTSLNEIVEEEPICFQKQGSDQKSLGVRYKLEDEQLSYEILDRYSSENQLIIDPVLIFSSYSGSTANNFGYSAAYDQFGYLYSASTTFSIGYPTTLGAYQSTWNGGTTGTGTDIAITKWDTSGTYLLYSTYLGGTSDELPHSLVVSKFNELYVMGTTTSFDYPSTPGAFDTAFNYDPANVTPIDLKNNIGVLYNNGSDIVVTMFDPSGNNLINSTFLGGTGNEGINEGGLVFNYADEVRGEILVDDFGDVYVASCTRSANNPISGVGFQTTKPGPPSDLDGILYKLNHNLTNLKWTNYLGGAQEDAVFSIALDTDQNIYVTGGTLSQGFPTTPGALHNLKNGGIDGFVSHISSDGSALISSTYYGTSAYDQSFFVEADRADNVYLFGQTSGFSGALVSNAAYNEPDGGQFISKLSPQLDSVIWSTRFGSGDGDPDISPTAFLVDLCNSVYISGWGSDLSFSVYHPLSTGGLDTAGNPFQGTTDSNDFYLMVMLDDASAISYATFMGGSAQEHVDGGTSRFDKKGKIYQAVCAGCGGTSDFPTYPDSTVFSANNGATQGSRCNLAVFKMDFLLPTVVADFFVQTSVCDSTPIKFNNLSLEQGATQYLWDFGDGSTSTLFEPVHTYFRAGTYEITLAVYDSLSCNLSDTSRRFLTVLSDTSYTLDTALSCEGVGTNVGFAGNPDLSYQWFPTSFLSDPAASNPICNPPGDIDYLLVINNGVCFDSVYQSVKVDSIYANISGDTLTCSYDMEAFVWGSSGGTASNWYFSSDSNFSDTLNTNYQDSTFSLQVSDTVTALYLRTESDRLCVATNKLSIGVYDWLNPIRADFIAPPVVCVPDTAGFTNTSDTLFNTNYLWDFGNGTKSTEQNPSTIFTNAGFARVFLLLSDSGVCIQSDSIVKYFQLREDTTYSQLFEACFGQDIAIGISPDTLPGTTYTWWPTEGLSDSTISDPDATVFNDTSYLLVVQNVCTDSIFNIIKAEYIFAQSPDRYLVCSNNPEAFLVGRSNGSGSEFQWSSSSAFTDTLNPSTADSTANVVTNRPKSWFFFKVITSSGCTETDSTLIIQSDEVLNISESTFLCYGDSILLQVTSEVSDNEYAFLWSPAQWLLSQSDSSIVLARPEVNTLFEVQGINDSGCVYLDSVLINVSTLRPEETSVYSDNDSLLLGSSTTLHAIPDMFDYSWSPTGSLSDPTSAHPEATPTESTTYTVTFIDPVFRVCKTTQTIDIQVFEIKCDEKTITIPNAFSPNGDGENDVFRITGEVVQDYNLGIYNRWGQQVFSTDTGPREWDGTFEGNPLNPAVFVYELEVTCIDGQNFRKKGNITLVR